MKNKGKAAFVLAGISVDKLCDPIVATRIRFYRKWRGLTQVDVAKATGLSQSVISRIEKDAMVGTVGQLEAICKVLGIDLFSLTEDVATTVKNVAGGFARTPVGQLSNLMSPANVKMPDRSDT